MTSQVVPFLDLVTPHLEIEEELVQLFREALRSAQFIGGSQVESFEREFAEFCGTKYAVGVANGTDAVRFALMASGIGAGDAVITVANTFIATVEAISQSGADTEFVDVDERTCNMSPDDLERFLAACRTDPGTGRPIGPRTGKVLKAVLPVHLYGQVADMARIHDLAAKHGLLVIEDACQAHGADYCLDGSWKRAGGFGTAAAFSFYPGKNLGACGEGGAVTTNDESVARIVKVLRDHGQSRKYVHEREGYNGRLDAIQAGILRVKLRTLADANARRRAAAARYSDLLSGLAVDESTLRLPFEPSVSRSVYHLYVIRVKERDKLAAFLRERGIQTGLHYPIPLHLQDCYRGWGYSAETLPVTECVAGELLSLPMYPGLAPEQQARVVDGIREFLATQP